MVQNEMVVLSFKLKKDAFQWIQGWNGNGKILYTQVYSMTLLTLI